MSPFARTVAIAVATLAVTAVAEAPTLPRAAAIARDDRGVCCGTCGTALDPRAVGLRAGPSGAPWAKLARRGDPPPPAATHEVLTRHYHFTAVTTRSEFDALAAVLEPAWDAFATALGAAPALAQDEWLRVYYFQDEPAWRAKVLTDCGHCPKAGGYYFPPTKTAYLYRQPTVYFTRVLLIHELLHQFHFLARTQNRKPTADWYTEGLAEHLSHHFWDGERLVLSVVPLASFEDYATQARAKVATETFDLAAIVEGRVASTRPEQWALVRYLATREDAGARDAWTRLRRAMDDGAAAGAAFTRAIGSARELQPKLRAWLDATREPWHPLWNEWEGIGPGRLRGISPGAVSACRVREPARAITASIEVPSAGDWAGGLLLSYVSGDDYTLGLVFSDGRVRVLRRLAGAWHALADRRVAPTTATPATRRVEARRDGARVVFLVDGTEIGTFELPGDCLGLAIQHCELRFKDASWTPLAAPAR